MPHSYDNSPINNWIGTVSGMWSMGATRALDPAGKLYVNAYDRNNQTYLPTTAYACDAKITCDSAFFSDEQTVGEMVCNSDGSKFAKFHGSCLDSGSHFDADPLIPLTAPPTCQTYFKADISPPDPGNSFDMYHVNMDTLQLCIKCADSDETCQTPAETKRSSEYPTFFRRMDNYEAH